MQERRQLADGVFVSQDVALKGQLEFTIFIKNLPVAFGHVQGAVSSFNVDVLGFDLWVGDFDIVHKKTKV